MNTRSLLRRAAVLGVLAMGTPWPEPHRRNLPPSLGRRPLGPVARRIATASSGDGWTPAEG
jgi:hypothetical protein